MISLPIQAAVPFIQLLSKIPLPCFGCWSLYKSHRLQELQNSYKALK